MPRGAAKIARIAKENKAKSDAYNSGEGFHRALYLKDDETATVRFCEGGDDLWYVYTHPLPKKPGQQYADLTLCLDQPFSAEEERTYVEGSKTCPACAIDGVARSTRVIVNIIRHDEPKLQRDAQGKAVKDAQGKYVVVGTEPALVVGSFAAGVGGRIDYLESRFGNITQHVCTIHKTGDKNNPYDIDIVERDKPAEAWEHELSTKRLSPFEAVQNLSPKFKAISLLNVGTMRQVYSGAAAPAGLAQGVQSGGDVAVAPDNPYAQQAQRAATGHINTGAFSS